jgi:hypothetical protein
MDQFEQEKADIEIECAQAKEAYEYAIEHINQVFNNPRAAMEILCFLNTWDNVKSANARRRKFEEEERVREEKRAFRKKYGRR